MLTPHGTTVEVIHPSELYPVRCVTRSSQGPLTRVEYQSSIQNTCPNPFKSIPSIPLGISSRNQLVLFPYRTFSECPR